MIIIIILNYFACILIKESLDICREKKDKNTKIIFCSIIYDIVLTKVQKKAKIVLICTYYTKTEVPETSGNSIFNIPSHFTGLFHVFHSFLYHLNNYTMFF